MRRPMPACAWPSPAAATACSATPRWSRRWAATSAPRPRPVVSLAHPGGLHTSYEPVRALVRVGQLVDAGTPIGRLAAGHPGCPAPACLHWGAMWGPASRADYVDPIGLLATTRIRLKPLAG